MEDIAVECGVSKMTVSRVLTGRNGVSAATRRKVLAAASRFNYEVNALAQNFSLKRSGFIGVATPFQGMIGSNYFGEVLAGFQRVLGETAWDFALFDTSSNSFSDGRKLEKLYRTRRVDGLLVLAPHSSDSFLDTLSDIRIPLVVLGETVASPDVCSVTCEDYEGIKMVCAHLCSLGHRRIAFVGGPPDLTTAKRRENAYIEFCRAGKLKMPPDYIQFGDYTMRSGRDAGLALLKSPVPPTAIVTANDMMAFGVIESARELNVSVPGALSVAGFDDLPTAAERFPSLTTVHQPVIEMAERSMQLLVDCLNLGQPPTGQIRLPVYMVKRQSTGPLSARR